MRYIKTYWITLTDKNLEKINLKKVKIKRPWHFLHKLLHPSLDYITVYWNRDFKYVDKVKERQLQTLLFSS
jgi:hypothetical protein